MAAPIDNEIVADLWMQVAVGRAGTRDSAGVRRAARTAENLSYTERQHTLGWMTRGGTTLRSDHQGRGWHDAHKPSKLA